MIANRWQRGVSFLIWLLVGLSAAFWGLRLGDSGSSAAEPTTKAKPAVLDTAAVVAALGGAPAAESATPAAANSAQRVELLGVIAQGRQGVALMSIDGQAARPYAVGNVLEGGRVLKAVGRRHAELADPAAGSPVQRLEMPPVAPAEMPAGLTLVPRARP